MKKLVLAGLLSVGLLAGCSDYGYHTTHVVHHYHTPVVHHYHTSVVHHYHTTHVVHHTTVHHVSLSKH